MKTKRSILFFLGLFFPGIFSLAAQAQGLSGVWSGTVSQVKPKETYPMTMKLNDASGTTDYPTLGCGGKVSYLKSDSTAVVYLEHITYGEGKCIDGGVIAVVPHGEKLIWEWRGSGYSASAVLKGTPIEGKK